MPNRKIPENEIHQLAMDIAKNIPVTVDRWDYKKIVEHLRKHIAVFMML